MLKRVFGIVIFAGVSAAVGCSATVDGSASDAGADAPAPSTSAGDASKPKTDSGTPAVSCYDDQGALDLPGAAPVVGSGKCSDAQISALEAACLGSGTACDAYVDANKDCARCVFGPLTGDPEATTPIGTVLSISDEFVIVNTVSCAAHVIGRADCALKLAVQETCLSSACAICEDEASDGACRKEAAADICKDVMDAACTTAIDARAADWAAQCDGASFEESYAKVTKYFCGGTGSPTDAGGGG